LKKENISSGWWHCFEKRQEDLPLKRGNNTASVCIDKVNEETMSNYLDLLEETGSTGKKGQVTAVACAGAARQVLPPEWFDAKRCGTCRQVQKFQALDEAAVTKVQSYLSGGLKIVFLRMQ